MPGPQQPLELCFDNLPGASPSNQVATQINGQTATSLEVVSHSLNQQCYFVLFFDWVSKGRSAERDSRSDPLSVQTREYGFCREFSNVTTEYSYH